MRITDGCFCCGESDPRCLRFYPVGRSVVEPFDISRTAHMTLEQARKELGLCLILCRNCQAKVIAERCCSGCGREFLPDDEVVQYCLDGKGVPWRDEGFCHDSPTCDPWRDNPNWQSEDTPPGYRRRCFRTTQENG